MTYGDVGNLNVSFNVKEESLARFENLRPESEHFHSYRVEREGVPQVLKGESEGVRKRKRLQRIKIIQYINRQASEGKKKKVAFTKRREAAMITWTLYVIVRSRGHPCTG